MWKWIVQESSLFWSFAFVDPGGGWVSFWNDLWVQGLRLASIFPRIAASSQSLQVLLLSCVDVDGRVRFDGPLRYQLRGGVAREWLQFQEYLLSLRSHIVSVDPASVVWPLLLSSVFSVKYFMAVLRRRAFPGVDDFPFRCIWTKEVPTKIQGFLWLVFHDSILTLTLVKLGHITL
ncbi:hypothetical protein LINGRAHAP2_LOCUS861 [Linum grandiflorum]